MRITDFVREETGQDLIEYTLLLAFVCLVTGALFISSGTYTSGIWSIGSTHLSSASSAAGS